MELKELFEEEIRRRGLTFREDAESDRYVIDVADGGRLVVSLDNLERDFRVDGDPKRVSHFVDVALATDTTFSADRLFWSFEPATYKEAADYRVSISDQVDRVLVHLSSDISRITWLSPSILADLGLSETQASDRAFENLARTLDAATVEAVDVDGVQLGFLDTTLPFKSSLILAPNLRKVVEARVGWPVLAVAPDREFLYLWDKKHTNFVNRVGGTVVKEYANASYPLSTEVFEVTDDGIRAIGAFPLLSES